MSRQHNKLARELLKIDIDPLDLSVADVGRIRFGDEIQIYFHRAAAGVSERDLFDLGFIRAKGITVFWIMIDH